MRDVSRWQLHDKTHRTGASLLISIISTKTSMTILKRIALANVMMKMITIKVMIAFQGTDQG